jgi:hypothetical protein
MNGFVDYVEVIAPGLSALCVITLTDIKDFAALAVALVTITCTILVTVHKLKRE